jgi:hypothetical protein
VQARRARRPAIVVVARRRGPPGLRWECAAGAEFRGNALAVAGTPRDGGAGRLHGRRKDREQESHAELLRAPFAALADDA